MNLTTATDAAGADPATSVSDELVAALVAETGALRGKIVRRDAPALPESRSWRATAEYALDAEHRLLLESPLRCAEQSSLRLATAAMRALRHADAAESKAAQLRLQADATLEINHEICNVADIDQLLLLISDRCRELLRCEVAGFALLEESSKTIVWRAMSGCRTQTHRRVRFPERGGVAGRAMSTGRPVIVRDFLDDDALSPDEFPISFAEGLRSILGVPLEIARRPRGCLMIGHRRVHVFADHEIDALTSFAAQAAIAVENAELYERVRREQWRLESVVQSINEGLVLVDLSNRVFYANRQARELLQLGDAPFENVAVETFFDRLADATNDPEGSRHELALLDRSAAEFPFIDIVLDRSPVVNLRLTHFHMYERDGAYLGRGYLCRDITFEKQVDAMKTEVISLVSHEIRTPLASIRGYASALLDDTRKRSRALQLEYLNMIDSESARLDDLVRNLTDVSKLDAGVLRLEMHEMSPALLVRQVVARWRKAEPHRRFVVACDEPMAPLQMDHRRIEQVLDNLISNALKYSADESVVRIDLRQDDENVTFSVADRGVGIPPSQRERVFDRFYRVHTGRRRCDGSGLGLYISRGIINAHNGRIWIESTSGEGTTICFSLPKSARPMG